MRISNEPKRLLLPDEYQRLIDEYRKRIEQIQQEIITLERSKQFSEESQAQNIAAAHD